MTFLSEVSASYVLLLVLLSLNSVGIIAIITLNLINYLSNKNLREQIGHVKETVSSDYSNGDNNTENK